MREATLPPPEVSPLQRQAVGWVQLLVSGQATRGDAEALRTWCAQSPAHAAAFAEASRTWGDIAPAGEILRHAQGEATASVVPIRQPSRTIGRRAWVGGGLAAAAAAGVAYAVIRPPLGLWPSLSEWTADYRTATGEQRQIELAGSLSITMNTQTSLAARSPEGDARRLELIAGEALFVAAHPLVVLAGDGRTSGHDARFDVRHMPGSDDPSVCVTCFAGEVRVERGRGAVALSPGRQARYGASGVGPVIVVDLDAASAWLRGVVVFRATPLAEVVEEINRYRPGRIILLNAALGHRLVSGRFRTDQLNEILERLQQAFDARIHVLPGGVVLMS